MQANRPIDYRPDPQARVPSSLNIIAGIWLIIAPWVLRYGFVRPTWNDVILGIAIALVAAVRVSGTYRYPQLSWANVLLGIWLIVAPFVLGYGPNPAVWNDIILGIIVIVLGAWSAIAGANELSRSHLA